MATRVAELETAFTANLRDLERGARQAERVVADSAGRMNRTLSGVGSRGGFLPGLANISEIIQGLPQIGRLAGALVSPLTNAAEAGVRFNAFLETTKIGFEGWLGSAEKAAKFMAELKDFGLKSPFEFEGLVESTNLMKAFGFQVEEIIPNLRIWGDAVASSGKLSVDAVTGVARAFGQMRALGRVNAEEMNQLAERGIPAWELLAKAIGKSVAETRKLGEQGKLRGGPAVQAITAMMAQDPRFRGQMARMSGTLTGRLSEARDTVAFAQAQATQGLTQDISTSLGAALQKGDLANTLAATINTAISPVSGMIRQAAVGLLGGGLTEGLVEGIQAGTALVKESIISFGMGSIVNPFANLLGIHSRSQVFYDFGLNIGEGLKQGLEKGLQGVTYEQFGKIRKFTEEQLRNIQAIIETGKRLGASQKVMRAALATGWVESNFRSGLVGDQGTAFGIMQQRRQGGYDVARSAVDPYYSAEQFYRRAMAIEGRYSDPGALAADVQRPARQFRGRYSEQMWLADEILARLGQGVSVGGAKAGVGLQSAGGGARGTMMMAGDEARWHMLIQDYRAKHGGTGVPVQVTNVQELAAGVKSGLSQGAAVSASAGAKAGLTLPGITSDLALLSPSTISAVSGFGAAAGATLTQGLEQASAAAGSFYDSVVSGGENSMKKIQGIFESAFSGAFQSADLGFKGMMGSFVMSFGQGLQQMAAEALSSMVGKALFGALAGALFGGGVKLPSGAAPAGGGYFPSFGMTPGRQWGGPVTAGMPYIVGERGPEMFVPGQSGNIVNKMGGPVVNIILPPAPAGGGNYQQKRTQREFAEMIAGLLKQRLS